MEARVVDGELAEVRWFTREEATVMLDRARRGVTEGTLEEPCVPGEYAVAHQLIRAWALDGAHAPPPWETPAGDKLSSSGFFRGAAVGAVVAAVALAAGVWCAVWCPRRCARRS